MRAAKPFKQCANLSRAKSLTKTSPSMQHWAEVGVQKPCKYTNEHGGIIATARLRHRLQNEKHGFSGLFSGLGIRVFNANQQLMLLQGAREGGHTLRKGVFLPSMCLLDSPFSLEPLLRTLLRTFSKAVSRTF